ncbi:MAG: hypothetical protein AB1473_12985 [Thermodesulfobacteriota bacterium]
MKEPILVVDADKKSCRVLCNLLEEGQYRGVPSYSLANIQGLIDRNSCRALIMDLDTVPVENRHFRHLKNANPGLCIVAISGRPFHPELKEAIATHIYACLYKPVDPDELIYLVKSIFSNQTASKRKSAHKETNAIR